MDEHVELIPRNYQNDLMNIAVEQNTIIYLPTGSGKTFIAILVLRRLSESLNSPYGEGGKISMILVNSVPLVDQHQKYVRDHTVLRVGGYTGEMNLDNWRQERWEEEFNKFQVVIMTSQIMVNLMNSKFIDLSRINLIIFDECHRGVDDHSMRQVMRNFLDAKEIPRILGLTATLLNGNCKLEKVMDEVRALETTFHGRVATVEGLEVVVGYSTNPREEFKFSEPDYLESAQEQAINELEEFKEIINTLKIDDIGSNTLQSIVDDLIPFEPNDVLKRLKNLINDMIYHIKSLGVYGGYKASIAYMIQLVRIKKHCQNPHLFVVLNSALTVIGVCKLYFEKAMGTSTDNEKVKRFLSNKVLKLVEIFQDFTNQSKEELCCIIFVKRRFTAKVINHILQALANSLPEMAHLKTNFMVGNANNPYNSTRENLFISKKNREVLNMFINKEINVLVASEVLEEGIDIPKCTLVVKFDQYEDYRSYIQSKGRARHKTSLYYTIVEQKVADKFIKRYKEFQEIESLLNELLIGKNESREGPFKVDIDNMYNEDILPPYYVDGPNSAKVDMLSSIALLCRYCSSLSSDVYTVYAPEWYQEKEKNKGVRLIVYLPVVCPLLDRIVGPLMPNKKAAKRAVALQACVRLHKIGELDQNLLPLKRTLKEEDVSYLFKHWPDLKEPQAGVNRKKRLHTRQISQCLMGGINANQQIYLHVIKFLPQYARTEDFTKAVLYDMFKTTLCFGILTPKPLPELCKFPLFDSLGMIEVEIKVNCQQIILNKEQISFVRRFHHLIFKDLLDILKDFLIFDNNGLHSETLLVVPVQDNGNLRVDFQVIAENLNLKENKKPAVSELLNLDVTDENYLHKIVMPWYRTQQTTYIVLQVCYGLTPLSPFPGTDFKSYKEYYEQKHSSKIFKDEQSLLLVKGLSRKLNTFKPRGLARKRRREKCYEEMDEHLVPELVTKQHFPACLWIQARFLPCILSRLMFLLKLHDLQHIIGQEINCKSIYLEQRPTLELDIDLLDYEPIEFSSEQPNEVKLSVNDTKLAIESSKTSLVQPHNEDFTRKMLEKQYPWRNIDEPKDVERELNVTVMDIEYYESFISSKVTPENRLLKNDSPVKTDCLAITYSKDFEEKPLDYLNIKFDNQIPTISDFYQALTAAEANDIVNLERLEILGDAFLKFIASLFIIFKYTNFSEGQCTTLKGRLVSNKNLFYLAQKKNFGGILKNRDMDAGDEWAPPCFTVPENLCEKICNKIVSINTLFNCNISSEEQMTGILSKSTVNDIEMEVTDEEENSYTSMCNFLNRNYVSDKTMADCVEALLGAFFLKGGIRSGIKFIEWIGLLPSIDMHQLVKTASINPILTQQNITLDFITMHIPQYRQLEDSLGYQFKNPAYLLQALTHASYSPNRITHSYERLEFLGDAILDFLITCYIFQYCGKLPPGEVTDLRSALVNNNTFASFAVRCGFHKFLLMTNSKLQSHIDKFNDYMAQKDYVIDDEVLILLEEDELLLAEQVDVPKVLGDLFEALAGAVYLDSNKDLQTVWKVFYKIMWKEIQMFSENVPKNVIRTLYECHTSCPPLFSNALATDNQRTLVALQFLHEGRPKKVYGVGHNKSMAKKAAAKAALQFLL